MAPRVNQPPRHTGTLQYSCIQRAFSPYKQRTWVSEPHTHYAIRNACVGPKESVRQRRLSTSPHRGRPLGFLWGDWTCWGPLRVVGGLREWVIRLVGFGK